MREMYNIYFI